MGVGIAGGRLARRPYQMMGGGRDWEALLDGEFGGGLGRGKRGWAPAFAGTREGEHPHLNLPPSRGEEVKRGWDKTGFRLSPE